MEEVYLIIALVTSGAALITGLNSFFTGLQKQGNRLDLIFGVLCLLLFIFLIFPPIGFILDESIQPDLLAIKRIFIWSYYGLFPFFLESYSGYRNRWVRWATLSLILVSFPVYLFTAQDSNPAWRILVLLPLGLNFVYGVLCIGDQKRQREIQSARWLSAAMAVYGVLFMLGVVNNVFGRQLELLLGVKQFFVFNLNPLAFIFIMGIRLQNETRKKHQLEKVVAAQNFRWERLVDHMPVVILELDADANIKYLNPYGCKLFGYASLEEMKGKNWIELTISPEERSQLITSYKKYFSGNVPTAETRFTNLTRDGQTRTIQWSSVLFTDNYIGNSSVLTIGVDTTDLEKAFRQLEVLKNELQKENIFLKDVNSDETETEIIGRSEAIIYAIQKARQVSGTHATVLLEGETGVGKELFANLIHKMSERCNMPLIKVNCAALPDELIESELFGHEKGSFTGALQARKGRFELAHGGTIFLDEIGEMPLSLQPKLLRVLQSGEFERIGGQHTIKVDVRLISATNKDLLTDVRQGKFREDLYYRLNVYPITIPSLRDRKEDIPVLVEHFIRRYSIEFNKSFENISKGDLNRLTEYDWPGNIRELINLIERSVISSSGGTLKIMWEPHGHNGNGNGHIEYLRQDYSIRDLEKDHILRVLRESRWKINGENGAAERLGLNPNTLRSRMKKLNIAREES